jgi:uracil-DNA glycosylase
MTKPEPILLPAPGPPAAPGDAVVLEHWLARARACRICAAVLPHAPRPVLRVKPGTRVLIIGQAPGTRAHRSGLPFDDRSGDRLRAWMGIDRATFYDHPALSMLPMGLCFPGQDARGADRPPPAICAATWHDPLLAQLPELRLTLLVGRVAQRRYLGAACGPTLAATLRAPAARGPERLALPHPSWRNTAWLAAHPWFAAEILPVLRARIAALLGPG